MNVGTSFDIVGQPKTPGNKPHARITAVSGDYARTLGTPIVRGRMVDDSDASATPFVVARQRRRSPKSTLPAPIPIGKQIDLGGKDTGMLKPFTIVGVLGDQVDAT